MSTTTSVLARQGKNFGLVCLGFLAALGVLSFSHSNPASAQAPGVNLTALNNQVQALQTTVNSQGGKILTLTNNLTTETTRAEAAEAALQTASSTYSTQISTLQAQTQFISIGTDVNGYPATFITGCNVWVQDGSGTTNDGGGPLTGLGNLIIGYNELIGDNQDARTGSHNLICGDNNDYTSFGGMIVGKHNGIFAQYASVSGGQENFGQGNYSSVIGGIGNVARGELLPPLAVVQAT